MYLINSNLNLNFQEILMKVRGHMMKIGTPMYLPYRQKIGDKNYNSVVSCPFFHYSCCIAKSQSQLAIRKCQFTKANNIFNAK